MNKAVQESIGNKRNVAKYVGIQKTDDHIFCAEDAGESTFLLNPHSKVRLMVKSIVTNKRWDYLTTFKPSRYLSIEAGKKFFEIEDVPPGSTEFEFVANRFNSTFSGRNAPLPGRQSMFAPGTFNVNNYGQAGFGAINFSSIGGNLVGPAGQV